MKSIHAKVFKQMLETRIYYPEFDLAVAKLKSEVQSFLIIFGSAAFYFFANDCALCFTAYHIAFQFWTAKAALRKNRLTYFSSISSYVVHCYLVLEVYLF